MHPWFQKRSLGLPDENIMADVVDSFKHFQNLNMFQKAAVTALAWRATDDETAHLREIFSSLDRDGNGHITVQELRGAIESTGVNIPEDLVELAVQADTDGGGTIEYTEFLAACLDKQKVIREEVVWEAFRIFDQDGSGTITKKELLKILTGNNGEKIRQAHGDKAVENFLEEYDVSGDAVIDFDEFMEMLNNVKDTYSGIKSGGMGALSPRGSPGTGRASSSAASPRGVQRSRSRLGEAVPSPWKGSPALAFCPCATMLRGSAETLGVGMETAPLSPRSARRRTTSTDKGGGVSLNSSRGRRSERRGSLSRRTSQGRNPSKEDGGGFVRLRSGSK